MDGDGLIGMISVRDVIKGLMHKESVSNRFLSEYSKG
jgi:hypothetical protein